MMINVSPSPAKNETRWSHPMLVGESPESAFDGRLWPAISIVTPSLNQAGFLEQAILSILSQGYPHIEHIVMDGGSTDGSVQILERYHSDLAFWASGPDGGQASAINLGLLRAKGEIFAFLNADDILLPGALTAVGRFFAKHPDVDLLVGKSVQIDSAGQITHPVMGLTPTHHSLLFWGTGGFNQPASFWRRDAFFSTGLLDTSLSFSFDYDMYLRLTRTCKTRSINHYLAAFRIHAASKTSTLQHVRRREDALIQHQYGIDRFSEWSKKLFHGYYQLRYWVLAGWFKIRILVGVERLPEIHGSLSG